MSDKIIPAEVNGRRITLDPIMESEPIAVPHRRIENSMPCGLRAHWCGADATLEDGTPATIDVTVGAGLGSPWLILSVKDKNTGEYFAEEIIDVQDLVTV